MNNADCSHHGRSPISIVAIDVHVDSFDGTAQGEVPYPCSIAWIGYRQCPLWTRSINCASDRSWPTAAGGGHRAGDCPHPTPSRRPQTAAFWLSSLRMRYHFAVTNISFAPELQRDWQLVSLTVLPKETVITVHTTFSHGVPSPVGRDGSSIMSYPAIYSEREQADFTFPKCLCVRLLDEATLSMLEANPD